MSSYSSIVPTGKISYKLFADKIVADIQTPCRCKPGCGQKLIQQFGREDLVKKVQTLRCGYWSTTLGNERTNKTVDLIRHTRIFCDAKYRIMHNFEGVSVCRFKWINVVGISNATYCRALLYVKAGASNIDKQRKQSSRNYRGLDAIGFMELMVQMYGDFSPESEKMLLPPCVTKKFIYEEYQQHPVDHVTEHHFYKIFNTNYKKTVIFASRNKINPCDICYKASNELHTLKTPEERENLRLDLKEHLKRQSNERRAYLKNKNNALARPQGAMSLIVDGMDQAKTNIPHFKGWVKPKLAVAALKTHVTGVLVHGRQDKFYLDVNQWPHDSNLTIACILNAVRNHISKEKTLPETLYIQCDNCGRENKNRYILGFLAYLCYTGYVKEVFLSFLMKGHTHEDVDQRFSKISTCLRSNDAKTLPELKTKIRESFLKECCVEVLGKIWNTREWIMNSMNDISNHSYPHQFWMFVDKPNHVSMKTRLWSTDEWYPSPEEEPLELFILDDQDKQCVPQGKPVLTQPSYEKCNLRDLRQAIEKMKIHLTYQQYEWWQAFLSSPEIDFQDERNWPLDDINPIHKLLDLPVNVQHQDTSITPLIEVERQRPKVQVKRKRKQQK